jgi:hypothetical protein
MLQAAVQTVQATVRSQFNHFSIILGHNFKLQLGRQFRKYFKATLQDRVEVTGLASHSGDCCRRIQVKTHSLRRETHTKRHATQHGCLPNLLGDGDKGIEIVYGEEKNILYLTY